MRRDPMTLLLQAKLVFTSMNCHFLGPVGQVTLFFCYIFL